MRSTTGVLRVVGPALVAVVLAGCSAGAGAGALRPSPSTTPSASTSAAPSPTPDTPPPLALDPLGAFSSPVWVGPAPGDRQHLFLVERGGVVRQLDADGHPQSVVLNIGDQVTHGPEQGLLSIAFDPAYARNHRMYVDYTDTHGNTQVVAYTVVRGLAARPQKLLTVAQPYANHNGGLLLFDRTGMLLVGLGDGGNAGDPERRAQNVESFLGKILRIDPRTGAAARGNPYPQNRYVWALGLRNPWRFSFDTNGDLYVGDVGQNRVEELDVVPPSLQRGANYGWSVYEGNEPFRPEETFAPGGPLIVPTLTYSHSEGGCSIVAGEVYHGRAIPWLRGRFVYGDYCLGLINAVRRTAHGVSDPIDLGVQAKALSGFGHDTQGELLVMTNDTLFRLGPA